MWPLLRTLEPYALDLWNHDIGEWLPNPTRLTQVGKRTFYGGLYQKLMIAGLAARYDAGALHGDVCLRGEWVLD
jgi:hypothetical protein